MIMSLSPSNILFYVIELLNSYAAVYYSNFLFFHMKNHFAFTDAENLLLAALNGFVYIFAAWQGGAFAERFGYLRALFVGLVGLATSLAAGLLWDSVPGQVAAFAAWTVAVCFAWPSLEALVSEGNGARLSDMVGMYNVSWAVGAAAGYFTGGMLLERLGMTSLYWFPLCLIIVEALLALIAGSLRRKEQPSRTVTEAAAPDRRPTDSRRLLYMAWMANPLSYIAINTVLPLVPSISERLGLSTAAAGILCSVWMFARLAAFGVLWRWTAWHYRATWLAAAFAVMTVCFALFVHPASVTMLLAAQVGFGLTVGLIYYSSLFYSMDASEKKGLHGGRHEAMIGIGLFIGPACGASSVYLFPALAAVWPVTGLLVSGLAGLVWMGRRGKDAGPESTLPHP